MNIIRSIILITLASYICSCTSQEEIARRQNQYQEDLAAADNQTCTSYGFKQATEQYANCRLTIATQRKEIEAADFQQRRAAGISMIQMQNYNNQMNAQRIQQVGEQNMRAFQMQRPVYSNCNSYSYNINCTIR